jgi:branched-subunit amino acid aminotransferase/4-amino-4-deoxychorismate lyase
VGADEPILLNARDEITEGARTNVFLRRGAKLLTPALTCGLLPGVLRAHLLATGEAEEAILTANDLCRTKELWVGNSVRGLIRAELIDQRCGR